MSDYNWTCPHCERSVTISESREIKRDIVLYIENADGRRTLIVHFIVCPNPDCCRFTLRAALHPSKEGGGFESREVIIGYPLQQWNLIPPSRAKTFPAYVPQAILDDYREACLIQDLSPKASATLSRRCLQGILRDFWKVTPGRLVDEIDQIKDKVDPETWAAIDAVRKIGNIGAHMEKDISVIVDVDPNEAELLIGLVETLIREWYIAREERKNRMNAIVTAAASKKKSPATP
jgi:Domain of unknown function (DUF4145)